MNRLRVKMVKTKLHLWNLPQDKTYILLKEKFRKEFFKDFLKYFSNWPSKAGKWLNVKKANIKHWKGKDHRYLPLWTTLKISNFLIKKGHGRYSIKDIENNLIAYRYKGGRSIFNPKFPINFDSKEGAIVTAAILCDGGINKDGYPLYNNSEYCMRKKVVDAINELVGNIQVDPSKPYENNCLFFPKILKSILIAELNMQIGDKVINNPKIPELFLSTNKKDIIGGFLNQAFSDDGTAYTSKSHNQGCIAYGESIDVSKFDKKFRERIKKERLIEYSSNLVKGCKILLEKLGIKVNGPYLKQEYTRKKGGRTRIIHSWNIQIQGRQNVKRYKELIGFSISRKNRKVDEILNNYKEVDYGTSFKDAWQKVTELKKKGEKITPRTFMKIRMCTLENARFLLKWLRKEGVIKRSDGGENKGIWGCTPYEYELVKPLTQK